MRTIYIDSDYICHAINDGTMREIQTDMFDGLIDSVVECHVFVPVGETYKGVVCTEGFIQCFDTKTASAAQQTYDKLLEEINSAYDKGVNCI